jgi:transglutaminase-like putative cysteine protease
MPETFNQELKSIDPVQERQKFVDDLVSRLEDENLDIKVHVLTLIFSHSLNDGFALADRLGVDKRDQFTAFISSSKTDHVVTLDDVLAGEVGLIEQDRLVSDINLHLTATEPKYISKDSFDFITDTVESFNSGLHVPTGKQNGVPKDVYESIKEYYLPFVQQKRFREKADELNDSVGEKLAYETFDTRRFVVDKNYESELVAKYIKDKTGRDVEFESIFTSERDVKKKFARLGLDYDGAVASKAIYVRSPLLEVYNVRKKEATKRLKDEIKDSLIHRGYDSDGFEVVEDGEGFKVVEIEGGNKDNGPVSVETDKVFDVNNFKKTEVDIGNYMGLGFFRNINGELVFRAKTKASNLKDSVIYRGKTETKIKGDVRELVQIKDEIAFVEKTGVDIYSLNYAGNELIKNPGKISGLKEIGGKIAFVRQSINLGYLNYDGLNILKFKEIKELISVDDKPALSAQLDNGKWIAYHDGITSSEYEFVRSLKEIDGKLAFIARDEKSHHLVNYDGHDSKKYREVHNLISVDNKPVYVARLFNGLYVINYDGQESKAYKKIENLIDVGGKPAFIAELDSGEYVVNYDGIDVCQSDYHMVNLISIGNKPAYITTTEIADDTYHRVVLDGKHYDMYSSVRHLIDLEGKSAFVATKNGKQIVSYDNKEIPDLEFDEVKLFEYNKETGLLFIAGIIADKMVTYTITVKELKKEKELKLNDAEKHKLQLLNLIKTPNQDEEEDLLDDKSINESKQLSKSNKFANQLNTLIDEDPALFFDDVRAKSEKLPNWRVDQITDKFFPEIQINKEKERQEKERQESGKRKGLFGSLLDSLKRENVASEKYDFFRDQEYLELRDADPLEEGAKDVGIEFKTYVKGMLATNINLGASRDGRWHKLIFPISEELSGPVNNVTATIEAHGKKEVLLPRFTDSKIITSRIKVLDSKGKDIDFTYDKNSLGQVLIKANKRIHKIFFSQEKPVITPAPGDITGEEYGLFREDFESRYGKSVTEDVSNLPPELNIFINSISNLSPIEKLIAIEDYVRKISYYDFNNRDVQALKLGKSNDERLSIMRSRLENLSGKGVDIQGKMFAGVCADFAVLTTSLLRKSGFVSGVITGLNIDGKTAKSSNSHGLSFVVWPSMYNKTEIYTIDGTSGGNSISMSIRDRLDQNRKDAETLVNESEGRLKEIEEIIESFDIERIQSLSNGELEHILNILLKYGVKRNNLHTVESILNTKYSPLNISEIDLDDISNVVEVTRMIDSEISRERKNNKKSNGIDLDSGKRLFETVQEFIKRFANRDNARFDEALNKIEKIFKISEKFLEPIESKAVFAIINYLRAKKMMKGE